jgi:uncharacterized membrane protein YeiB
MRQRILGFDLARAYAIFGMYIVNFNICFGSLKDKTPLGNFLNLFVGNSTSIFIICAGMGVSLMTNRITDASPEEKKKFKLIILKRSWFLFVTGLLLYNWWPGDILHFYGGYMHIAAFLLFVPKRYFLIAAILAIAVFHVLLFVIPIGTGWDYATFKYVDFWTLKGFLRNTLYNGWNSIFPWIAYFFLGMWLGRINWQNSKIRKKIFLAGLIFFSLFEGLRLYALHEDFNQNMLSYIYSDYIPPYLPFMVITASYALMIITVCIWLGNKFSQSRLIEWLTITGSMTLSNYVFHLTIGMVILQTVTGEKYTGFLCLENPASPTYILFFSVAFFILTIILNILWSKKFKKGPLEILMRKVSD